MSPHFREWRQLPLVRLLGCGSSGMEGLAHTREQPGFSVNKVPQFVLETAPIMKKWEAQRFPDLRKTILRFL